MYMLHHPSSNTIERFAVSMLVLECLSLIVFALVF